MKLIFIAPLILVFHTAFGQDSWITVSTNVTASFRGLSVVDDKVAWVSGSNGWVGHTGDGGIKWHFSQVEGFDKMEFRSLFAWDSNRAAIANAGSPASILYTADGGKNWTQVYRNDHKDAFFDGMDFLNEKEGIAYGDPINGKMLLVKTEDGGQSWKELAGPSLADGEASFAASGTGIRFFSERVLLIATGGKVSRIFLSADKGKTWTIIPAPIVQGKTGTGIFSVACQDEKRWVIVGGDFEVDTLRTHHVFYTLDGGEKWIAPEMPTRGYRECAEVINASTVIATGPKGTDISSDGGKTWVPLREGESLHVVRRARRGKLVIMAGGTGTIRVKR